MSDGTEDAREDVWLTPRTIEQSWWPLSRDHLRPKQTATCICKQREIIITIAARIIGPSAGVPPYITAPGSRVSFVAPMYVLESKLAFL